jgi:alkanesulfonate monooxygenase SsuD/methylene tetrahydromethanopterin reductase-like flavin-dependent oxidoreductase (luciferase family)
VAGGSLAIGDDIDDLRDLARPMLAVYFGGMGARTKNFYNDVLRRYGFEKEADLIQDAYLGRRRKEAAALVPKELVSGMSLVGDAGFVKERITAYREAGVTVLNVLPMGPNGLRDIETIANWVG